MSFQMSPKFSFNYVSFSFMFFLVKLTLFTHAHLPYPNSPNVQSPKPNVHHLLPLTFLENFIDSQIGHEAIGILELKNYLSNIGYLKDINDANIFDKNLESALKRYQLYYNLEQSGILDNATIQTLLKPRCGVQDFYHDDSQLENRNPLLVSHYSFFPNNVKWPPTKTILTYSFQPGTREDVVQPIAQATSQWASVTHFKFDYIEDYKNADIKISFQYGDHGDGSPFDGPHGTLAHCFGPLDGRLHYDAAEKWIDGVAPDFLDLQTVGLHELGHALGLMHSTDPNSIMYAYTPRNARKGLSDDDIAGVQAIYQNTTKNSVN